MFHRILVLLKLLLFFQQINARCPTTIPKDCDCWNKLGAEDYTLRCPKSTSGETLTKFTIKVKRNEIIHIECDWNVTIDEETLQLLPKFNFKHFETLRLIWCPLASRTTFNDVINTLQISGIKTLRIQNFRRNTMHEITREHFKNLNLDNQTINRIEISGVLQSVQIPQDLFNDMYALRWLALNGNRDITFENEHVFDPLENLQVFDLSDNQLKLLPRNIFKNLNKLKSLSLRDNQLTFDDDETLFENLNSLIELNLSDNNITQLPVNIFFKLINLEKLYLIHNNIKNFDSLIFNNNKKISVLNLSHNPIEKIDHAVFKNLDNLQQLQIDWCHIHEISENAFNSLKSLEYISLVGNQLETLPEHVFDSLISLKTLKLGHNRLSNLSANLFDNLISLEDLHINDNNLDQISFELFQNLINLKLVDLQNNQIHTIGRNTFVQNEKLEIINLSNNQLEFSNELTPFGNINTLKELDLSGNQINRIPNDWRMSLPRLKKLNLSHNRFKKLWHYNLQFIAENLIVDLQYNEITYINMYLFEQATRWSLKEKKLEDIVPNTFILSHNPINCDCTMYDFFRYVRNEMDSKVKAKYNLIIDDLVCENPLEVHGRSVSSVKLNEIYCSMEKLGINKIKDPCPKNCTCNFWPHDKHLYVNCSHQNLRSVPEKIPNIFPNIVLDVTHNNLDDLIIDFNENETYRNMSILYAAHNNISNVILKNTNGKSKLKILQLNANNLNNIDVKMLNMTTLRNITLFDNPWICSCDFVSFARSDKRIAQLSKMKCGNNVKNENYIGQSLTELPLDEICQIDLTIYLGVTLILVFICLLMGLFVAYLRNKMAIKVWLYQYNIHICFWLHKSENENKLYDAFVSYSHEDEDFVVNELIPNLEHTEPYFRLCLHHRDWIAGEWIPDQIAFSVENSSRTIVVLSKSFLKSVWGKMEFRVAHLNAISERKARVIIIKLGDIGPTDSLDPELRAYLKLNTYIEWGTKDFWSRLRYALPHNMNLSDEGVIMKRVIEKSLEHTQLQLNIDDTIKANKILRI